MALQNSLLPVAQDSTQTLPPSVARDLTNTDIQRIQGSLDHSVSDNTQAMYASAWRAFQTWTRARGVLAMPASTSVVAAYLAHLAEERRLSVETIRLHKAALAAVHKPAGHEDPTDSEGVRKVMQGISRTHGRSQRQAKPLTAEALAAVKATAKSRRALGTWAPTEDVRNRLNGPHGGERWSRPAIGAQRRIAPALRGRRANLGRRGAARKRIGAAAGAPVQDRLRG